MGAVRGYNNDCRDCYYYRDNFGFAKVGEDGCDYYRCAKCTDRTRLFNSRYGETCGNLKEIYDVEQAELAKRRQEEAWMVLMYGDYLLDENGHKAKRDSGSDLMAFISGGAFIWFYVQLICSLIAGASVSIQLILLGMVMAFSRNIIYNILGVRKTLMLWTLYCTALVVQIVMMFIGVDSYESGMFLVVLLASIPVSFFAYKYITVPFYVKKVANNGGHINKNVVQPLRREYEKNYRSLCF